jgi:hypothetical protein
MSPTRAMKGAMDTTPAISAKDMSTTRICRRSRRLR